MELNSTKIVLNKGYGMVKGCFSNLKSALKPSPAGEGWVRWK